MFVLCISVINFEMSAKILPNITKKRKILHIAEIKEIKNTVPHISLTISSQSRLHHEQMTRP